MRWPTPSRGPCRCLALLLLPAFAAAAAPPVSFASLLREMTDRDALTRFPDPAYRLVQFSSHDRASVAPDQPGWFANHDNGFALRKEVNQGRHEWVIFDHRAPGAIVRWWMPDRRIAPGSLPEPEPATMRIYFDGESDPAFTGHPLDFFNGQGFIKAPFAHSSLSSAVSYLPIPYARRCKVTLDREPFFYIITAREYPAGTPVRTFSRRGFDSARQLVAAMGDALLHPGVPADLQSTRWRGSLAAGAGQAVELPGGAGAVREIELTVPADADPRLMRALVLSAEFDGHRTVWSPVGEFFGTGIGLNPFEDWTRTVTADGTLTCRWVMPYRHAARLTLHNYGDATAAVGLRVGTRRAARADGTMYFHATWRYQYPLPTQPRSDWNYLTVKGRGVYVGDNITLTNPEERWWGEGDAKTWVDGESFPSLFGTGMEDYYGYAWGGNNTDFYGHPFHSQIRAHLYNQQHRRPPDSPRTNRGYSTETRIRALDGIVFNTSLQHDMEVYHVRDCAMEYSLCTYWYAPAGAVGSHHPDPADAARPLLMREWLDFKPPQ